ncbi:hypothetical protein HTG_18960 [Natrinema mahii]|nr:hypothetical protein HTG_18960 [Natrinema mahii]
MIRFFPQVILTKTVTVPLCVMSNSKEAVDELETGLQ